MFLPISITLFAIICGATFPKNKICIFVLSVLLYILFVFEQSGGDYAGYVDLYNLDKYDTEWLFMFISKTGRSVGLSFDQMRSIVGLFEIFIIYKIAGKFSLAPGAVLSAFFVFPAFLSAELFRWLLGYSIIIYGLKYILEPRGRIDYVKYVFCVVLAALSHSSCWFFLLYLLILIKKRKLLVNVVLSVIVIGLVFSNVNWFFDIFRRFFIREHLIEKYQTGSYANTTGVMISVAKSMLILVMSYFSYKIKKSDYLHKQLSNIVILKKERAIVLNERIFDLSIISQLIIVPVYFSSVASRLLQVPLFLMFIALSNKGAVNKNQKVYYLPLLISVVYLVSALFLEGGNGTLFAFISHFTEGYLIHFYNDFLQ